MELELQYTELSCCEAGESVTLTQEEALEAAIPEYCPEVTRIVDAVGQLCLREYTSLADQRLGAGHGALYLGGEPRPAEPDAAGAVSDPKRTTSASPAATSSAWRAACC